MDQKNDAPSPIPAERRCQYPIGDLGHPDFHFCGAPRSELYPQYCEEHAMLCYSTHPGNERGSDD